jgi:hypothetical protein
MKGFCPVISSLPAFCAVKPAIKLKLEMISLPFSELRIKTFNVSIM